MVDSDRSHSYLGCVQVRGAKVIVRWFSHEVADLEPTLSLLQQQDRTEHQVNSGWEEWVGHTGSSSRGNVMLCSFQTWETRYILLLWLSIIVMIPFDLSRLDGSIGPTQHHTISRVLELARLYLTVTDKSQDAASLLCAKLAWKGVELGPAFVVKAAC